ncbi:tetratricopeptide repeat protein [Pseudomonas sp. LRF_L74]|uniref:tetratricopeptide repeat protein n=1 Tax=Pseudomonas sp. LRF_L74 TaxID=3369422 RepID=UPI003F608D72
MPLSRIALFLTAMTLAGCASSPLPWASTTSPAPSGKEAKEALRLAHTLRDNQRMQAAYEVYSRMDQRQQLHGSYLLEYASVASTVRPGAEVLGLYERARKDLGGDLQRIAPAQRLALCNGSGRARLALGQASQAERDFRCALEAEPNATQALNGLGVALDLQGKPEEARAQFEKAMEIDPGNNAALNNLALAWLASGDSGRAIGLLNQARNNGDASLQLNLALAYVLQGHDDTAHNLLLESATPEYADKILAQFQSARDRVAKGMPLSSELLAASLRPLALNEQD